jgi:hypothetical protein
MIFDIPSPGEFQEEGISSLNLAWGLVTSLISEFDSIESAFSEQEGDLEQVYWTAAKKNLTASISLVQQGVEFLLKGKIAEVSPFLLITGQPKEWPRSSHVQDTPFSDFKTIDAQELLRVHDTIARDRLPESFKQWYESMRRQRNTIMHTVSTTLLPTATDVVISILEAYDALVKPQSWVKARSDYLRISPTYIVENILPEMKGMGDGYRIFELASETFRVIEILEPALVKKHFGFNKKQRKYLCPACFAEIDAMDFYEFDSGDTNVFSAVLRPNEPTSITLYCILCDSQYTVRRESCNNPYKVECKENVIDAESNYCLSCWGRN